jgi:SAM-dependent methyltransferase
MFRSIRHRLALFTYSWHAVGPATMLRNSLRWTADAEARTVDSGFDARHGTDTNGDVTPGEAAIPAGRRGSATMYLPTMDQDLDAMLAALPWSAAVRSRATFVDLGSGKGRVVLMAAMRCFREVVGVELSPVLHAAAAENVARVDAAGALSSPVRLVLGDATEVDAPDGPLVAYLYHPFHQDLAAGVVDRLVASLAAAPRPLAVLYGHPTLQAPYDDSIFTRHGVLVLAAAGARRTRHFALGWSVWTNQAWLDRAGVPTPASAAAAEA